jgi:hypothetical protein
MISHLNEKYGEEFVYVKYIPREEFQSETLVAYPRSTGSGDGKYFVTVKTKDDGFTDDYSDFSVLELVAEYIDDFLSSRFSSNQYRFFWSPHSCDIQRNEIEDGDFQWKCGNANIIFLSENVCNMDNIEVFSSQYAQYLYSHRIDGTHRIQIIPEFPANERDWKEYVKLYDKCSGFYCFHF